MPFEGIKNGSIAFADVDNDKDQDVLITGEIALYQLIAKLYRNITCSSTSGVDVITACDSYTWIDGNTYTASNKTATYTLTNAAGCDSVVTLNLTIDSVSDVSTTLNGVAITANNNFASYVWMDCDNNFSPIPGETNTSFSATKNGNYAVQLSENDCVDTSACLAITTVGITENSFADYFDVYPNPTNGEFVIFLLKLKKI